jgi:hypothetical protein
MPQFTKINNPNGKIRHVETIQHGKLFNRNGREEGI